MKKRKQTGRLLSSTLVAAGLLGAAGAVQAQSSVTLYGIVDGGFLYTSRTQITPTSPTGAHQFSFTDSGTTNSLFGMRGAEDLGGGMRAVFQLENGFSVANGGLANSNGNLFGRQAWIGVESPYGKVKAGVQFSPFFISLYETDPRGMSYFGSALIGYLDNVLVTGLFNSNAISYTSPEIAGLEGSAMMALGGTAGNFQAGRQYSVSLTYHLGGFMLTGALYNGNNGGSAATTPTPSTIEFIGRTLGASYRFANDLSIYASYALYKTGSTPFNNFVFQRNTGFSNSVYSGGASYRIKPYLNVSAGVYYTRDGNNSANHSLLTSAEAQFYLSKRTTLYGQIGYVNNRGAMDTGLSVSNALFAASGSTVGVGLGMRHMF
ncbi:porin [Paraburkholderia dinghuensis]|uniref:Porin n=1 Tax=Paraburkholderia dinghuensis TaxID=2305225 RepID=A0A3N6NJF4_9BURK|nr:porin [Paraburkholderia dinghuensis]RQH08977.1 porin [Paraburkholderia dinghuensis]